MPTSVPEEAGRSELQPHQARHVAESFGTDAELYDRARPRYPDALIHRIVAASPGPDVVDVGCGTGIVARQFQVAGCKVVGVEPDARMAEFARGAGVDVDVATFEAWDPAGRTFDAVVAGTAWHWIDPEAGIAKAAAVLRPGGRLAAFGHVFAAPAPIAEAFATAFRRVAPDSPLRPSPTPEQAVAVYEKGYAKVADGIRHAGGFGEPEQWRYDWEQRYTRDEWLELLPTTGGLTRLPADQLSEVLDAVGAAVDAIGGSFTLPFTTLAVTARRTA